MEAKTYGAERCSATAHGTGKRCRRWAILGATVCPMHGGSAPQVKAKARDRIQELLHPAITRLADLIGSDDERVAFNAIRFVYDHSTDEHGDPLGLPMPTAEQVAAWLERLEAEANT